MLIMHVMRESSKNQIDPKEDTDKPSPNAEMAASRINFFLYQMVPYKKGFNLMYDMPILQIIFELWEDLEAPKKILTKPLPMLEWQAN